MKAPGLVRSTVGEHAGPWQEIHNHHVFCNHCGVRVYTYGHIEQIGGDYVSVALSALDDLPADELIAAPVRHMNGRDDDWFNMPAETRHL
jgi:hypothetical protein